MILRLYSLRLVTNNAMAHSTHKTTMTVVLNSRNPCGIGELGITKGQAEREAEPVVQTERKMT